MFQPPMRTCVALCPNQVAQRSAAREKRRATRAERYARAGSEDADSVGHGRGVRGAGGHGPGSRAPA
eukprot:455627-Rhodomonas_salina.2